MNKSFLFVVWLVVLIQMVIAIPTVTNYVTDNAGILSNGEIELLTEQIQQIRDDYSVEIAILTINGTEGMDRIMYANKIGEQSGVGNKETDNGIVILWSVGEEKGGAIATGRGIESVLNDAKVARIGREIILYMDKGQFFDGFKYILNDMEEEFKADNSKFTINKDKTSYKGYEMKTDYMTLAIIIIILIILFLIFTGNGGVLLWFLPFGDKDKKFDGGSFGGGGGKF